MSKYVESNQTSLSVSINCFLIWCYDSSPQRHFVEASFSLRLFPSQHFPAGSFVVPSLSAATQKYKGMLLQTLAEWKSVL